MRYASPIVLLGCAATLVASPAAAQQVAQADRIPISKDGPRPQPAPPPTTGRIIDRSMGGTNTVRLEEWNIQFTQFDAGAYTGMSEASVAAHMAAVDSLQNFLATTGRSKLQNPRAQEFAARMAQDYAANYESVMEKITDEKVGAAPLAQDPELDRLRQAIRKFEMMPTGPGYDAAFLRFQMDHHNNEMAVMRAGRPQVHDDDFEKLIDDEWMPQLQQRRDLASSIAAGLP